MRRSINTLPSLILASAMVTLSACGSGATRTPAPAATPAPTPTPTTVASFDVLPCINQVVPLDRVPPGTRVIDLIIPDTITIWPDRPIGFPNGRLLSDPVIDITLGVILLDINRAGQNAASFAAIPLDPPQSPRVPIADFPFAAPPYGSPPLDSSAGTAFAFDSAPMSSYVQVDRMGMPAVATAIILGPRKNAYSDGNVQLDTANTYAFDLIEGLRVFSTPLQDDIIARGLVPCAVRRVG